MINDISQISNVSQLKLQHKVGLSNNGFGEVLKERLQKQGSIQFSKHATERVQQRGIEVSESFLEGLNSVVEKARDKGAKDVVVIAENGAFIINVPNNVVVTTVGKGELKESIFTNIDSAVIM